MACVAETVCHPSTFILPVICPMASWNWSEDTVEIHLSPGGKGQDLRRAEHPGGRDSGPDTRAALTALEILVQPVPGEMAPVGVTSVWDFG